MFIPIGDENIEGGHKPLVSYSFLAINVLVFLWQASLGVDGYNNFIYHFGTIPTEIVNGQDYFTLFTNVFLHANFMHLAGNMLFLWIFADNIEAIVGSINFTAFYILGGLFASLLHVWFNTTSEIPAVGASGAIAAVMGAYLVMFPKSKIKILVMFLFKAVYVPALMFLGLWFLYNIGSGLMTMGPESAQQGGTAWWAHIGGFIFGLLAGYYAKKSYLTDDFNYQPRV